MRIKKSIETITVLVTCLLFSPYNSATTPGETETPIHKIKQKECIILLHGLARTKRSMQHAQDMFKAYGYETANIAYPSTEQPIETLAAETLPEAIKACQAYQPEKIHFVTHSMGGILVRYYLTHEKLDKLGRMVMISPPNQGSEVVDKLGSMPGFESLNGPAGQQLGTDNKSLPRSLGPVPYETGIITGDRSINLILSLIIPGDDDGKVSIHAAKVEGMADFIVVPHSHPFIMKAKDTLHQSIYFLQNGSFYRSVGIDSK